MYLAFWGVSERGNPPIGLKDKLSCIHLLCTTTVYDAAACQVAISLKALLPGPSPNSPPQ